MEPAEHHTCLSRRSLIEDELNTSEDSTRNQLLEVVLEADSQGSWVSWPLFTNRMACRASLLRALLFIGERDTQPRDYINTAATACNTAVQPISTASIEKKRHRETLRIIGYKLRSAAANLAGQLMKQAWQGTHNFHFKSPRNIVTDTDFQVEDIVLSYLQTCIPGSCIHI